MATEVNAELIQLVKNSGVLNPSSNLDDLINLNQNLGGLEHQSIAPLHPTADNPVTAIRRLLIHQNFLCVYNDEA